MLQRKVGIEIEALAPPGFTKEGLAATLNSVGVPSQSQYSHVGYSETKWTVKHDGSLLHGNGMETVSPPAKPDVLFPQLDAVCSVLGELNFHINKSCGLHVHVDVRSEPALDIPALKRLALLYIESEEILDAIMPPSRRGNLNRYARTVTNTDLQRIARAQDATGIAKALSGSGNSNASKYVKINFAAFWSKGTVEFRHHSGTIDAAKIRLWAMACVRMVEKARTSTSETVNVATTTRVARAARAGTKSALVYGLLTRPEGCTTPDILQATGWPSVTVPGMARTMGLELRQARERDANWHRVTRYWGTPSSNPITVQQARRREAYTLNKPGSIDEFAERLGMTDDEKVFWRQRAALFAAPSAAFAVERE